MTVLLASVVDVTIILALGLGLAAALRRRSAAVRHAILAASIVCAALTPAFEVLVPQLPIIRTFTSTAMGTSGIGFASNEPASLESAASLVVQESGFSWQSGIVVLWAVASLITLAALALSLWRLRTLRGSCSPAGGRWRALTDSLSQECGVNRPVQLLQSEDPALLVTYGAFTPKIILPASAADWPSDRQAVVLRHELAHIRRGDAALQMAGEFLRVWQPFNPLVWMVCGRLRRESEYACDDAVLSSGVQATDYAAHLFEIARRLSGRHTNWAAAAGIAEPSTLERRIVAMLEPQKNRTPVRRRGWILVAVIAAGVSLPIAAIGVAPGPGIEPARTLPPVLASLPAPAVSTPVASARRTPRPSQTSLSGKVQDATGAVIPGVAMTLTNLSTQETERAITNASGSFQFLNVPPAKYELASQLIGFRKTQSAVDLSSGTPANLLITLEVGALSETVTVSCKAPSLIEFFFPALSAQEGRGVPIRVGGQVTPPRKTKDVRPVCPDGGVNGNVTVILEGRIGIDGLVNEVRPVSSNVPPKLTESAIDAVRQWEFTPTLLNRQPVAVTITVSVTFTGG